MHAHFLRNHRQVNLDRTRLTEQLCRPLTLCLCVYACYYQQLTQQYGVSRPLWLLRGPLNDIGNGITFTVSCSPCVVYVDKSICRATHKDWHNTSAIDTRCQNHNTGSLQGPDVTSGWFADVLCLLFVVVLTCRYLCLFSKDIPDWVFRHSDQWKKVSKCRGVSVARKTVRIYLSINTLLPDQTGLLIASVLNSRYHRYAMIIWQSRWTHRQRYPISVE